MHRFETVFGQWVVKYRWLIIFVTVAAVVFAASGIRYLQFVNDSRIYFSKENPQLKALEALENTYTKNENILFVLAPKDSNVFTNNTLKAVEELTEEAWKIPFSSRVDSITNFQHTRSEDDDLIVENLVENAERLTTEDLKKIRTIALSEPLLVNRLISPKGDVAGVNVNILKPGKHQTEVRDVATYVQKLAADFQARYPDIDILLTGGVMIDNAFGVASEDDMTHLLPAMYLILLIIMGLALRSFVGTIATSFIIGISMVTALGLAGWLSISLNPSSANAPTIILTLAVADSVHILISMFTFMRQGKAKHSAISEAMRINLQPVFLTSLTTAIGFLTMNFSDAPPFRDLGNIVAIGVTAAFFYSAFFLPALMAVVPIKVKAVKQVKRTFMQQIANVVIKRQNPIFWIMIVLMLVLSSGISRIDLNDDFVKYFDDRYDFRRATDFAEDNLTGFDIIEYSLAADGPNGIYDPAYLNRVEKFANWFRKQPGVVHVNSVTDIMKRLNKNMHSDDNRYYSIPTERELAAQYLLLYEMSLPFGLDLNDRINVDKSATRFTVTLAGVNTKQLRRVEEAGRSWLKANAPEFMFTYGSGLSVMFAHISERNIKSMLWASVIALTLISCILILAFRSLKLGLVSFVPNMAPAFMAFGIWGVFVGEVGLAVSVLIALTMGIVVDDTIHFISKYQRARSEHKMSPDDAVRYAFSTVGTALWVTTATLTAGFIVLSFSGFKVNSDIGVMTAITILAALLLDFLLLPILLIKAEAMKNEAIENSISINPSPVPVPVVDECRDSRGKRTRHCH